MGAPTARLVALFWTAYALVWRIAIAAGAVPHIVTTDVAVGPQYDSTHVYVAPAELDAFVASFTATFGGHAAKAAAHGVTVLVAPIDTDDRRTAVVRFPGGFIAEIHASLSKGSQQAR
jgi:hypothetical protein